MTKPELLFEEEVSFQTEARLLEELGERLVASADLAIVELVKNAYDADASICTVELDEKNNTLTVKDDGHGITKMEFLNNWMSIATGSKLREDFSKHYKRKLTGAKGIGRFSVRFLADYLTLESIAYDEELRGKTKLIADFNWKKFSQAKDIRKIKILYRLYTVADSVRTGTTLILKELRKTEEEFIFGKEIFSEILKIVTPVRGLDANRFDRKKEEVKHDDPGFDVKLVGEFREGWQYDERLAAEILSNYWFKLIIDLNKQDLHYKIYVQGKKHPIFTHTQKFGSNIRRGLRADIRFFPRRAGIFTNKGFDGRAAWRWIKENSGVAVIDHSFRMKPYGFGDDDWLKISQDKARNERNWRSNIMQKHYEIPETISLNPAQNPMLCLPGNHQLVSAVFVESGRPSESRFQPDLIPAMDRAGFLENKAFSDLFEIVRTGIEMLGLIDRNEQNRIIEQKAQEAMKAARDEIQKAMEHIKAISTLSNEDKNRIIEQYAYWAENIEEIDEYHRRARQGLETMSLLGVVASFMTHESQRIMYELRDAKEILHELSNKHKNLIEPFLKIEEYYCNLSGYIDYSSTFIKALHTDKKLEFKVLPQIERIIKIFGKIIKKPEIKVIRDVDKDLKTPAVSVALYSGVLLNLYTNALKAVLAGPKEYKNPEIAFKAWNDDKKHIIEMMDNGIGIPPSMKQRIWDPLFTTTSQLDSPFGSGMGLGLSIVKKLLSDIGGSIKLVKPPRGFSTCFRVEFPFKGEKKNV